MVEKEKAGSNITQEEVAQSASRVLLVGMKGLGANFAKNLILAGVKGLTMLDPKQVSPEDPEAQAEASLEQAQNLNPVVDMKVDTQNTEKKPESFFTRFDMTCLTCCSRDVKVKVDQICPKNNSKFFRGDDVFGYNGYTFANLGEYEFVEGKTKVAKVSQWVEEDGPDTKRPQVDWSSDKAKVALKFTTLGKGRDTSSVTFGEDSEFVVGGILAQEIVKPLSQRDPLHNNIFFFDGMKGNGFVECLHPK
ncbi:unnamed protein product [Nyctereutes procyonoides]|uniref:(raccoon dog) hypothetical protein n=1 Tax=Nyctereutes procyonoides TaxID=34880 RepID=A0A811YFL2_NYCPR|nr:unnamed protein product [Nyctereutes procyonoides]